MIDEVSASWDMLDHYVSKLRTDSIPSRSFWSKIESKPMGEESIGNFIRRGCNVRLKSLTSCLGLLVYEKGNMVILIKEDISPYERDKTLFHELAHLHYDCNSPTTYFTSKGDSQVKQQMEASIEWVGRKARADHELLRHAILSFGLEPYVYDQASYRAFNDLVQQPSLPLLESKLLMD